MPAVIPIAVAAISAAGSIGGAAMAAHGARGGPSQHQIPLTPGQAAYEHYMRRLLALNATQQPPSFGDWEKSGGTATFPTIDPGFSPQEARRLGIVGPRGQQIPFVNKNAQTLTPEQQLYLGYQQFNAGQKQSPLARAYHLNQRLGRLEDLAQTPKREARESRIASRRNKLMGDRFTGGLN